MVTDRQWLMLDLSLRHKEIKGASSSEAPFLF